MAAFNNTRSKQFIKLLTAPDGSKESMVQRVVRQLRETGICDSITVATSQSQRDIIINQLGEEIPVVTEPERRDIPGYRSRKLVFGLQTKMFHR